MLCQRIDQYPEESVTEHVEKRYVHIKTMADLYKSQHIESYEKIPPTIAQFMKVQNIKLLPILIMDLENTLFPSFVYLFLDVITNTKYKFICFRSINSKYKKKK